MIRNMVQGDLDTVREVDSLAFWSWGKQVHAGEVPRYRRTRDNVQACLERDPAGCFVAEEDGRAVGFIFSRTWGGVAWFGTFAVLPEYQGRGLGKQLIAASLEYLRREPRRLIGLETMFDSPSNIGLYLGRGFQVSFPSLVLSRELPQPAAGPAGLARWSEAAAATQERWLGDLREASGHILPGLDYSKEIIAMARHGLGETLVLTDGARAVGMSIVRLVRSVEGAEEEQAGVHVLALHPDCTSAETFRALVEASEALAQGHARRSLALVINTAHTWALEQLLAWGYRVSRAIVRMVQAGTVEGQHVDRYVDCSRWAG